MERRPPEHPPSVEPHPVEVFVPSYSNQAKHDKSGNANGDKLVPRAIVKKSGFSIGRRSSLRKAVSAPMEILEEEADISSDEEMIVEEEFKPSEDSTPLAIVHPPKRFGGNGFPSPPDLTSPVSVLPKRQVISSTSFCNVVPSSSDIEGDAPTAIRDEVLSPIDCLASALPRSESSTQILDDSSFPPLPKVPTLLAQSNSNCDLIAIEHLEKNPRSDSPSVPSSAKELSYASVVNDPLFLKFLCGLKFFDIPLELWTGDNLSMVPSKIGIPLAFDTYTEDMCLEHTGRNAYARILIEISVDSNWTESVAVNTWDFIANAPTCLILPVEYSWKPSSCVHCKVFGHSESVCAASISSKLVTDLSPKPNPNPSNSKVAKNDQIAPPDDFTSFSDPTLYLESFWGKMSRSVYDSDPDGLNGKNRFEILNAIYESFCVFCDQDGAAFPIEPCTVNLLREELAVTQNDVDKDPFNHDLREIEATYLKAFYDALCDEERLCFNPEPHVCKAYDVEACLECEYDVWAQLE
ncbi:hypothetical protein L2E82_21109 [Cichorium intybus]|uniref:Uncharacterized protein n=1 Tax=Cichorium intybus TaxID=13427 RepID=A0ACB9DVI1_CICIN|nr:hypothetical protein L2E82_21109 [Cichorium intybus]